MSGDGGNLRRAGRPWLRYGLYALAGLGAFGAAVLVAVYFALRSPAVMDRLLPVASDVLESTAGVALRAERVRIDLLSGAELRGLEVRWTDPQRGEAVAAVDAVSLAFRPGDLLGGRLFVERLRVAGLDLDADLRLPASSGAEPSEPEGAAPVPGGDADTPAEPAWRGLAKALAAPPLALRAEELAVTDSRVDLRVVRSGRILRYRTPVALRGSARWAADGLRASTRLDLGAGEDAAPGTLFLDGAGEGASLAAEARPALSLALDWTLERADSGWALRVDPLRQRFQLAGARVTGRSPDGPVRAELAVLDLRARLSAATSGTAPTDGAGPAAIFPLRTNLTLRAGLDGLDAAAGGRRLRLERYRLQVDGENHAPDPDHLLADFRLTGRQELSLPGASLDAGGGPRAALEGFRLRSGWKLRDGDNPEGRMPPPFTFEVGLQGGADRLTASLPGGEAAPAALRLDAPSHAFRLTGSVDRPGDLLAALRAELRGDLGLDSLEVRKQGAEGKRVLRMAGPGLTVNGSFAEGAGSLQADLDLPGIRTPLVKRSFRAGLRARAESDAALERPSAGLALHLDGERLASLSASARDEAGTLRLDHRLAARLGAGLAGYHAAAVPLRRLGGLRLEWEGEQRLEHGAESVLDADFGAVDAWPAEGTGLLSVAQLGEPAEALPAWGEPLRLDYRLARAGDYTAELALTAPALRVPPLEEPVHLKLYTHQGADWPLTEARAYGLAWLEGERLFSYGLSLDNAPGDFRLRTGLGLAADPDWAAHWSALKPLERAGRLDTGVSLRTRVAHPHDSILALRPGALDGVAVEADLSLALAQGQAGSLLRLHQPLVLREHLEWSPEHAHLRGGLRLPSAVVPGRLAAEGLALDHHARMRPGRAPDSGRLEAGLEAARLALPGGESGTQRDLAPLAVPLRLTVEGARDGGDAELEKLALALGGGLAALEAAGRFATDGGEGALSGRLTLRPREEMWQAPALSGSGTLQAPWQVTWMDRRRFALEGRLVFRDLGLRSDRFRLAGLSGEIPFHEELERTDSGGLRFAYLAEADPFQRVAFSRVRPYLDQSFRLDARKLEAGGVAAGPLRASLDMEQNLLRLRRFELGLLGGHLGGELYLDATPGAMRVGFLGRVSQVDLRPLLADEAGAAQRAYAPVSARAAVSLDVARLLLEGRVDITRITRAQLLQVLALLDPAQEDPQLDRIRSALRVAHPQRVSLRMRNSLLDLEVALSALKEPIRVRGVPLTPLLQRYAADTLRMADRFPLEE
ncbi:hypothetical protein [Thiohalorhabdus methylotrophus]|uniref:DUF748 domain-containing protein n=1 Tax=Thiohalorhabdus methylotrophus TaxID=3242694 RepID=A0ABV4TUH8_9GAMM